MAGNVKSHVRGNLIGYLALFVALSGSAYAAATLEKNEVKSKHIKNAGVKTKDLAKDAVTSPKVADGSLLSRDFAEGQIPQGDAGPPGPAGQQGDTGPAGATNVRVRASGVGRCEVEGCSVYREAECQLGERAVGGGGYATFPDDLGHSFPIWTGSSPPTGWRAEASEEHGDGDATVSIVAYAVCASP